VIMQILHMHESLRRSGFSKDDYYTIFGNSFGKIISFESPQLARDSDNKLEIFIGGTRTNDDGNLMVLPTKQSFFVKQNIIHLFSEWRSARSDIVTGSNFPEYEF
jgi:hypothetical protein